MPHTNRAWIELNPTALADNLSLLAARLPAGCRLMPAIKANAYGHGATQMAGLLCAAGIDAFCVASAEEGAQLRSAGVDGQILVLGYTHPDQFCLLHQYSLTQSVVDADFAAQLSAFGAPLCVHLCVDTGMHRLGFSWQDIDPLRQVFALKNLQVTGMFTHLSSADGTTPSAIAFTHTQSDRFWALVRRLRSDDLNTGAVHLLNSAGLLRYPWLGGDFARVGIALYGLFSTEAERNAASAKLRPVLSLYARVASVRTLCAGEGAGYALAYNPGEERRIAALSIGYADGLPRSLSGGVGRVLLHGQFAPIVGRVCMDQTLVDVTGIPNLHPGDIATLIGQEGTQTLHAETLASQAGTITNEIVSCLGQRLDRVVADCPRPAQTG